MPIIPDHAQAVSLAAFEPPIHPDRRNCLARACPTHHHGDVVQPAGEATQLGVLNDGYEHGIDAFEPIAMCDGGDTYCPVNVTTAASDRRRD